ncbi:MAG: hypothetical protein PHC28_05945 [Flavobacterium sp.]|uniref:hypothetical protein n=1 Tax=Flavobacterium sp. TaxID=239 RepID=UPI0026134C40|nr:hypothetical protein [Flavobacterium sp.]MDD5150011.1 hypothetical protein [Flavobacterium sp.]
MAIKKVDNTNTVNYKGYRYPSNVGTGSFSSCIMFTEYVRNSGVGTSPGNAIILYMPERASNPSTVNWESKATGVGVNAVSQMLGNNQNAAQSGEQTMLGGLGQLISNGVGALAQGAGSAAFDAAKSFASSKGVNIDLSFEEAQGIISRTIPNPYIEYLFKGVDFRNFEFSFKLYPHSQAEAENIYQIIKVFRSAAYPNAGSANDAILGYPNEFDIEYLYNGKTNKYLNKFKRSVLTKVDVDYTSAGSWTMTRDGFPSQIELNLSFSEIQILVASDIRNDISQGGGY